MTRARTAALCVLVTAGWGLAGAGRGEAAGSLAVVRVAITYSGGPVGAPQTALQPGHVTAFAHGRAQRASSARAGARATLRLRPGRYVVRARSGDADCAARRITARAGRPTSLRIRCSVR